MGLGEEEDSIEELVIITGDGWLLWVELNLR